MELSCSRVFVYKEDVEICFNHKEEEAGGKSIISIPANSCSPIDKKSGIKLRLFFGSLFMVCTSEERLNFIFSYFLSVVKWTSNLVKSHNIQE